MIMEGFGVFRLSSFRCYKPTARRGRGAPATLAALLLAGLAAACGSSQENSSGTSSVPAFAHPPLSSSEAPTPTSSWQAHIAPTDLPTTTTATPTHTSAPISYAMGGSAENGQGDRVHLTVSFEEPAPASDLENDVIDSCSSDLAAVNSSLDRSLAVAIHVSMEVTSELPTTVLLKLGDNAQAVGGGQTEPAYGVRLWAMGYSSGPECGSSVSDVKEAANIQWTDATPNSNHSWNGWLILAGSITPSDPTGSHSTLGGLLISPHVMLAGSTATFTYLLQDSPNLVSCSANDAAAGGANYVAVRPDDAKKLGCRRTR
jgi:hypothetical protein